MYSEKYQELERLSQKAKIGRTIIITLFIIMFVFPFIPIILPNIFPTGIEKFTVLISFVIMIMMIIIFMMFLLPYNRIKNEVNTLVKQNILREEVNSLFNSSYKEETEEQTINTLKGIDIGTHASKDINDCFSAIYNKIKFSYSDVYLYTSDDDGTTTYFSGPLISFDLKNTIEGKLYIAQKHKVLIGKISSLNSILYNKECKEITPNNNILSENILMKSNNHQSIIENIPFQQAINKLVGTIQENRTEHILVFTNNKLYVLFYNHENAFEINVKKREDEITSRESIREDLLKLRNELDNIIQYKEQFNIKEDIF